MTNGPDPAGERHPTPDADAPAIAPADLRAALIAMAAEDQRVRAELVAEGTLFDGYHPRMAAVHHRHAARLAAIMDQVGWPGRSLVGDEAADAAWLVLQHSIGDPAVMRQGLALLEALPPGEVLPGQVAVLEDRVRHFAGLPQRYGSQFDWDERGEMSPVPIDDPAGVEARRRSVGLPPLDETIRRVRADVARETERPPADLAARRQVIAEWAREVGWRP